MLGISVSTSDSKAVYDYETGLISIEEKVSVYEVSENTLADGRLEAGDVLLSASFNEKTVEITRQYHIIDLMLDVRVGDTVTFNILRNGEELSVDLIITEECLTEY